MKTVKIEDVRKDCIYHARLGESSNQHIFRAYQDGGGYKSYLYLDFGTFHCIIAGTYKWDNYTLRFPTTEEADWLVACEQAGKFVPRPEIQITRVINDYEIY